MALVATALLPHAPLLAPSVGKDHRQQLRRTIAATERVGQELYALQPDVIVVLTPHGQLLPDSFFCNVADSYQLTFETFGDLSTILHVRGNPACAHELRSAATKHHHPVTLGTTKVDYGVSIPLSFLSQTLERATCCIVSTSGLPITVHRSLGQIFADTLAAGERRAAIIASVELSHRVNATSPAEQSPAGKAYDSAVLQAVRSGDLTPILKLASDLVAQATVCSQPVLAFVDGVFHHRRIRPTILSYEAPLGVGEIVAFFPSF